MIQASSKHLHGWSGPKVFCASPAAAQFHLTLPRPSPLPSMSLPTKFGGYDNAISLSLSGCKTTAESGLHDPQRIMAIQGHHDGCHGGPPLCRRRHQMQAKAPTPPIDPAMQLLSGRRGGARRPLQPSERWARSRRAGLFVRNPEAGSILHERNPTDEAPITHNLLRISLGRLSLIKVYSLASVFKSGRLERRS